MSKYAAIITYHGDPLLCGVTRWNYELAKRLDVPVAEYRQTVDGASHLTTQREPQPRRVPDNRLLISIKPSEMLGSIDRTMFGAYDVLLHSEPNGRTAALVRGASQVYTANADLAARIPKAIPLYCPGTLHLAPRIDVNRLTVLCCGMAHKFQPQYHARLAELLDADATVGVSAALHEGTPADTALRSVADQVEAAYGSRGVFLGYLSDRALRWALERCTYFAAFFEGGVRENNTTVMSALALGKCVITNCNDRTPAALRYHVRDITRIDRLPPPSGTHMTAYTWDALVEKLNGA